MSKAFATLTPEQKKNFENRLQELGLDRSHVVKEIRTGATQGPTYFSSHPDFPSAIPPQILFIPTLAKLRQLAGVPDERYLNNQMEGHPAIPPEWPQEKNNLSVEELTPEENRNIHKAFIVHIYGHSDKAKSYEKIIEKIYFPFKAAAFAAEDVVVDADHPLVLKDPAIACNFGVVTIKPGGQIRYEGDVEMTVQRMVKEEATIMEINTDQSTFINRGRSGQPGGSGQNMGDYDPTQADSGTNARDTSDGKHCRRHATDGQNGQQGYTGGPGDPGDNGKPSGKINLVIAEMIGHYDVETIGGDGGDGGNGGNGGRGQAGGAGGKKSKHCSAGHQGAGGKGGTGGTGGNGGDGGDAGDIYITYTLGEPTFDIVSANGGAGGQWGAGGKGGPGGDGDPPGGTGDDGVSGKSGQNGGTGNIYISQY